MSSGITDDAQRLRSLHKPGSPVVFTNVWDAVSAKTVAAIPSVKALATASYAVAAVAGLDDNDLTLEINLAAAKAIAPIAHAANKPLTVDWQDGYGNRLEEGIKALVEAGVVGINLEDYGREKPSTAGTSKGNFYSIEENQDRIRRVMKVAKDEGVPSFVVNARCDTLVHGGSISEAIERGNAYLEAGAANIFVWGGASRGGITRAEVEVLCKAFEGKLNVSLKAKENGGLSVSDLSEIGVARISLGPQILLRMQKAVEAEVKAIFGE